MISRRNIFLGFLGLAAPAAAKARGAHVTVNNLSRDLMIYQESLNGARVMTLVDMRRVERMAEYYTEVIQKAFKDSIESGKFKGPMIVGDSGPELMDPRQDPA